MDTTDKKRAHSANHDSATTPPSKRHQSATSSAQAADGQQSAAVSGQSTAMAMAAATPSAEPTVAASSMPAGHAASAISRPSPGQRCPLDPLSVALSFLDTRDFAVASRVCRHWRRTADLQSAWPEFSVERLISGLIDSEGECDWIQSRLIYVNDRRLRAGVLEQMAQSPKWRRVVELHLNGWIGDDQYDSGQLSQVAQLPQLQSLQLESVCVGNAAAAFSSLAPRLLALMVSGQLPQVSMSDQAHLHLLVNLRALVLGTRDRIDGQALLQLHQLEYLQLDWADSSFSRDLLLAIRRLSVQHRLRHLSLSSCTSRKVDLNSLVAELDSADSDLAPAALVSIRLRCDLSDASSSAPLSLPNLTRLDWSGDSFVDESAARQQQQSTPSPLQRLHLGFYRVGGSAAHLLQQAAIRAPQLRELHITSPPPAFDKLIRQLRSLRLLDITLWKSSTPSQELLQSLASLPLFSELVVQQGGWLPEPFRLTVEALRCMAESPSWRLIRVIRFSSQIILPDDVDARLAGRLADLRVQVAGRGPASVHRLVTDEAQGTATWLQTAM